MAMNEPGRLRRGPVTAPPGLDTLGAFATDPFVNLVLALQDPLSLSFGPQVLSDLVRQAHTAPVVPGMNTLSPLPFSDASMAQMFVESLMGPLEVDVEVNEERPKRRKRTTRREPGDTTVDTNKQNPGGRGRNPRSARNSVANLGRR